MGGRGGDRGELGHMTHWAGIDVGDRLHFVSIAHPDLRDPQGTAEMGPAGVTRPHSLQSSTFYRTQDTLCTVLLGRADLAQPLPLGNSGDTIARLEKQFKTESRNPHTVTYNKT